MPPSSPYEVWLNTSIIANTTLDLQRRKPKHSSDLKSLNHQPQMSFSNPSAFTQTLIQFILKLSYASRTPSTAGSRPLAPSFARVPAFALPGTLILLSPQPQKPVRRLLAVGLRRFHLHFDPTSPVALYPARLADIA